MRIKLTVAYDGTDFHGWQFQPEQRTVEGDLNKAVSEIVKKEIQVIGASRTDAGVHAYGNVAVFDTDSSIPPDKFAYALNTKLKEDVRIVKSEEVAPDFHPRYQCHNKTYEYHLYCSEIPVPTKRRYSAYTYKTPDVRKMKEGAEYLIGKHDFASFQAAGSTITDTVRTIYFIDIFQENEDIVIKVNGDGFLYNMVRIIAGTLINVGCGKIKPEYCKEILESCDRKKAGPTAPACGLFLREIFYDGSERIKIEKN